MHRIQVLLSVIVSALLLPAILAPRCSAGIVGINQKWVFDLVVQSQPWQVVQETGFEPGEHGVLIFVAIVSSIDSAQVTVGADHLKFGSKSMYATTAAGTRPFQSTDLLFISAPLLPCICQPPLDSLVGFSILAAGGAPGDWELLATSGFPGPLLIASGPAEPDGSFFLGLLGTHGYGAAFLRAKPGAPPFTLDNLSMRQYTHPTPEPHAIWLLGPVLALAAFISCYRR